MISNTWVGNFESFITSAPSSTLSVDDMKNSFHNFVVEDFARNDVVRGVPLWVDLLALVYHKPYLLETGDTTISKNWNDFMTQAQNMTQYDENGLVERAGFSGGNSENVEFSFEMMNQLILQARSQPFDVESLGVPFNEDEKNAVSEAMDFYRTFSSTNNKTWDSNFKLDTAEFIEGDLASIVIPSWRILDIEAYDKDRNLNLDIEVAKVPQLNPDTLEPVYYPTYWGYVVSKESSKSSISWEFLKFITDRNQQEKYIQHQLDNGRLFPMISPRKDLLNISREYEYLVPYVDSIEKTHSWYMINGEKLEPVYDEVLNSSKSIDEIMITFESLDNDKNVI